MNERARKAHIRARRGMAAYRGERPRAEQLRHLGGASGTARQILESLEGDALAACLFGLDVGIVGEARAEIWRRRRNAATSTPTPRNAAGVPVGSPRIGERVLPDGEREPDERVLADLRRIAELRGGGDPLTFEAISAVMNAEGRKTQRGAAWSSANVQYALRRAKARGLLDNGNNSAR